MRVVAKGVCGDGDVERGVGMMMRVMMGVVMGLCGWWGWGWWWCVCVCMGRSGWCEVADWGDWVIWGGR